MLIVPGLAVAGYAEDAALSLTARGHDAHLLPAPASPGSSADLSDYGTWLSNRIEDGPTVDLLVGLSVGTQAAAAAAAGTSRVRRLLLVSPTVDPGARSMPKLMARWAASGRTGEPPPTEQVPEWRCAGAKRLFTGIRSATMVRLEAVVPSSDAKLTVVHTERDGVTSHHYAAHLASEHDGQLVVVPGATHSWPHQDAERFCDLVEDVLA